MIKISYSVTCDNCEKQVGNELAIASVDVLLNNPNIKKLWNPALPLGWLFSPPKQAGKIELHFCSGKCQKEWRERTK